MSGSTEHWASGASERSGRREVVLNLGTARRMLPLVAHIVADLLERQRRQERLAVERDRLEQKRRSLSWSEQKQIYRLQDEIKEQEQGIAAACDELDQLGVALIEPAEGRVGLPTVVNGHLAYFSWRPGDEGLRHWHFAGEMVRRTIPASWKDAGDIRLIGKS